MSHTPGPWKVIGFFWRYKILDADDTLIAVVENGWDVRTNRSNASLISAAPDLLEACRAVLSDRENYEAELTLERVRQLRAAVAKAEGREAIPAAKT